VDPRIKRVITLIEDDCHKRLSLETMALMARMSSSRLRHKFKSELGVTPTVYLQNVRMRKAAELLKDENLSVKEVRAAIGLESDSYFTHLCERIYGVAPSRMKEFPCPNACSCETKAVIDLAKYVNDDSHIEQDETVDHIMGLRCMICVGQRGEKH
jgi:AraC-like DNA-binding protein